LNKKLQKLILDNWPAKVLSIGCALIIFVFYRTSTLEERFFSVPLLVEGAGIMVPANYYPKMVRVTLRGNANSIYPVMDSDIEAYLDISSATEKGTRHFPVLVRKKGTALTVETFEISVDPMEITLTLDLKLNVFVKIAPQVQGDMAPGYELAQTSFNPSRIRIEGPEGLIRHYSELPTEIINLEGRTSDFAVITRVLNPDQLISLHGETIVEFRGEVRPIMIIRKFSAIPVNAQGLDRRLALARSPLFDALRVRGPQNELEPWKPDAALFVDCAGITAPGAYDLPLQTRLPESFTLLGADSETDALPGDGAEPEAAPLDETSPPLIHVVIRNAQNSQMEDDYGEESR
jgi:hypothetical protein